MQEIVILAFALLGAGLKYIDEAFDGSFEKRFALLLAPALTIVWISLSLSDAASATILLAILLGVLLAGKADNFVFKGCAAAALAPLLVLKLDLLPLPLLVLGALSFADEAGNEYVEKNRTNRAIEILFLHRFGMKLGMLALCAAGALPWLYFFALLSFDVAYEIVGALGARVFVRAPAHCKNKTILADEIDAQKKQLRCPFPPRLYSK